MMRLKTNLEEYVAIYNINNPSICKEIIESSNNSDWNKHSYNDPITLKYTTYEDDLDVTNEGIHIEYLNNRIEECLNDYIKTIPYIPFGIQGYSSIRFNRYQVGTNMKYHFDHIHTLFDGERKGIPILSILGILNDDFEGGDFLMFDNKKVELTAGDIILFPSNFMYPHAVTTVTKGTRYSFVSWAY
jgi:hypothetical protein